MMELLQSHLTDPQFLLMVLIAVAAAATVLTVAMPLLETDMLGRRMKAVALERDRIRARERERMARQNKISLCQESAKPFMKRVVEGFSLSKWLGTERAKQQLALAGYRGPQAEVAFLFFRMVAPVVMFISAVFYLFIVVGWDLPTMLKVAISVGAAYLGIKAPEIFLSNVISKRQLSMRRAFPDTLDLLLICVESGMSIEMAFRKVNQEIGAQSVPMAEELTLTTAELSFLPDRRSAFENFANRTGLDSVKQIVTVLIQAERYGTPLGNSVARCFTGKPRHAHAGGGKESRLAAAKTDGADDRLFLAGLAGRDCVAGSDSRRWMGMTASLIRRPVSLRPFCHRASECHARRCATCSASSNFPCSARMSAKFWRTRMSALGLAAACGAVASASLRRFESA
jgi:tight adherence protein C